MVEGDLAWRAATHREGRDRLLPKAPGLAQDKPSWGWGTQTL